MTAVEWLEQQLTYQYEGQTLNKFYDWKDISEIYNKAKEMHKQEIIDAVNKISQNCVDIANKTISAYSKIEGELFMHDETQAEKYYNDTYGSKVSDETLKNYHIVDTNEMVSSQIEISDEEIEKRIKEVGAMGEYYKWGYRDAINWYREQLKKKL